MASDVTSWFHKQVPRRRVTWILLSIAGVCALLLWRVYPWPHDAVNGPQIKFLGYEWDRQQPSPVLMAKYQVVNLTGGPISFHEVDDRATAGASSGPARPRFSAGNKGARIASLEKDEERIVSVQIPWTPAAGVIQEPIVEVRFVYWDGKHALLGLSNVLPDTAQNYLRAKVKSRIGRPKVVNHSLPRLSQSEMASSK